MSNYEQAIKIIYKVSFQLNTALHVGSGYVNDPKGAAEICVNGKEELIIPGTSIAGVFLDEMNRLCGSEKNVLYNRITGRHLKRGKGNNIEDESSFLKFRTVVIPAKKYKKIRDRVKIDGVVKAAEEGSKFSHWEIEPELDNLEFFIEVDFLSKGIKNIKPEDKETLIDWVENVLGKWNIKGFHLGAFSSGGMGGCNVVDVFKYTVNSPEKYSAYINAVKYDSLFGAEGSILDSLTLSDSYDNNKYYRLSINLKNEEDDYGTNGLLIKGGDSHHSINDYNDSKDVDAVFINTGKRAFIPGSSIKGAIGATIEKWADSDLYKKWQDLTGTANDYDELNKKDAGKLIIEDLFPVEYNNKNLIFIERHAENEFTRAVLGGSKFNEERLFYTEFSGKVIIKDFQGIDKIVDFIKQLFENRLVSLGSNFCFPEIKLSEEE